MTQTSRTHAIIASNMIDQRWVVARDVYQVIRRVVACEPAAMPHRLLRDVLAVGTGLQSTRALDSPDAPPSGFIGEQPLKNEEHEVMSVLDAETGKILNYCQLVRDPKYKKDWQLSSANEFGRLANSVGGRIRGTNTIKFGCMHEIPKD